MDLSSTNTALSDLLPSQRRRQIRTRSRNYMLPNVRTSHFKSVFINRCLFDSNEYFLVVFLMYFFAFLYSFYCHVNCCKYVYAMNY